MIGSEGKSFKVLMHETYINTVLFLMRMNLKVFLEKQEEGGYTVYVPSLPGCISEGETKEEALKNIKEAIELYLEADTNETLQYEGEIATIAV